MAAIVEAPVRVRARTHDDGAGGSAVPGATGGGAGPVALGDFLRAMRNHRQPHEVGLAGHHGNRRVPGLRRQEVADLADVSLDYYTRIEQGRVGEVSGAVLAALGRALRLTAEESTHLRRLASPATRPHRLQAHPPLRPQLVALADAFAVPASVVTPGFDVVAANLPWRLLTTPAGRPPAAGDNLARRHFLDPSARRLRPEWESDAVTVVAGLRVQAARHPGDQRIEQLVRELGAASADFRRLWAVPVITGSTHGRSRILHPRAGEYRFDYETLETPGAEGLIVTTYCPTPGSGAREVLDRLLAEHHRAGARSSA